MPLLPPIFSLKRLVATINHLGMRFLNHPYMQKLCQVQKTEFLGICLIVTPYGPCICARRICKA